MSRSSEMLQVILLRLDSNDYPERTWVGKQYTKANLIQDLEIVRKLSALEDLEAAERSPETYEAWKKVTEELESEALKDWPDNIVGSTYKGRPKGFYG